MAQVKLWSSPTAFASRAYFRTTSHPAQLLVDNIQLRDEGVYRCRVDFRNSPTRNMKINFTVIGTFRSNLSLWPRATDHEWICISNGSSSPSGEGEYNGNKTLTGMMLLFFFFLSTICAINPCCCCCCSFPPDVDQSNQTEPPERPVILDKRRGAKTKLIEPYNEGSDVSLTCEVNGGEFN